MNSKKSFLLGFIAALFLMGLALYFWKPEASNPTGSTAQESGTIENSISNISGQNLIDNKADAVSRKVLEESTGKKTSNATNANSLEEGATKNASAALPNSADLNQNDSPETPLSRSKSTMHSSNSKTIKNSPRKSPQLMEMVDDSSEIGEETVDSQSDSATESTNSPSGPPLDAKSLDELLKDANLIVSGFTETDTDQLAGVWSGAIQNGPMGGVKIAINRIWDHMTDDYLPSSCLALNRQGKVTSGYLRSKTLNFYEKKGPQRSHLIVKLNNRYLFDILSPRSGSKSTSGKAYESKGGRLILLGTVILKRDVTATADTDCAFME